jgi:pre-mRNA-splicing factor SYF1
MFNFYAAKAIEFYGLTSARPIFEKAIEVLPDKDAKEMCMRFADLELKLGEIDRARALYAHASQFADPRLSASFWQQWQEFEVRHGNEDTFKEMLRIKRSVQAQYNTDVSVISAQMLADRNAANGLTMVPKPSETFVSGGMTMNGKAVADAQPEQADVEMAEAVENPDEIDVTDDI